MRKLAKKDYIDSKTRYVIVNYEVGKYAVDLTNVQCIIVNLQGSSNETITLPFISTSYVIDTSTGVNITVNFGTNEIIIDSLPTGFKLRSYLLIF